MKKLVHKSIIYTSNNYVLTKENVQKHKIQLQHSLSEQN